MEWAKRVNLMNKIRVVYHATTVVLAIVCIIVALYPDADTGFYGALVIFLFTSIVAIESIKDKPPNQRVLPVIIGAGLLFGAYLLLADGADTNPLDWELLGGLVLVWLMAAVIVFAGIPLVWLAKSG